MLYVISASFLVVPILGKGNSAATQDVVKIYLGYFALATVLFLVKPSCQIDWAKKGVILGSD